MLLDARIDIGHFIRYLGSFGGTGAGGLVALYNSLTADEESPSSESSDPLQIEAPPESAQEAAHSQARPVSQPQGDKPHTAGQITSSLQPAYTEKMLFLEALKQQLNVVTQIEQSFSDLDSRWPRAGMLVKKLTLDLRKLLIEVPSNVEQRCVRMAVNPLAPPGESMKRLKRAEERGRNRSQVTARPPLSCESPGKAPPAPAVPTSAQDCERVEPFPRPRKEKEKTILEAAVSGQTQYQHRRALNLQKKAAERQALHSQGDRIGREPILSTCPELATEALACPTADLPLCIISSHPDGAPPCSSPAAKELPVPANKLPKQGSHGQKRPQTEAAKKTTRSGRQHQPPAWLEDCDLC